MIQDCRRKWSGRVLKDEGYMQAFSRRLRLAREKTGMTREEAAEKIGISYKTLADWELSNTAPHISIIIHVARTLNASVVWLITGKKHRR